MHGWMGRWMGGRGDGWERIGMRGTGGRTDGRIGWLGCAKAPVGLLHTVDICVFITEAAVVVCCVSS